jgi:hypothetical protein
MRVSSEVGSDDSFDVLALGRECRHGQCSFLVVVQYVLLAVVVWGVLPVTATMYRTYVFLRNFENF